MTIPNYYQVMRTFNRWNSGFKSQTRVPINASQNDTANSVRVHYSGTRKGPEGTINPISKQNARSDITKTERENDLKSSKNQTRFTIHNRIPKAPVASINIPWKITLNTWACSPLVWVLSEFLMSVSSLVPLVSSYLFSELLLFLCSLPSPILQCAAMAWAGSKA